MCRTMAFDPRTIWSTCGITKMCTRADLGCRNCASRRGRYSGTPGATGNAPKPASLTRCRGFCTLSWYCTMSFVFSRYLFPGFATISYCRRPCVSEALPAPWTWTGSSPHPGTAGGPEPDATLQIGCAEKDCTASLPRWWKDSENRPRVTITARLKIHVHILHWTCSEFWVTNDCPCTDQTLSHQHHQSCLSEETVLSLH